MIYHHISHQSDVSFPNLTKKKDVQIKNVHFVIKKRLHLSLFKTNCANFLSFCFSSSTADNSN